MDTVHQFPVPRNQAAEPEEALARALRRAVDAKVGADASFERREVAALALTNEATRLVTGYRVQHSIPHIFRLYYDPESGITSMCRIGLTSHATLNGKTSACSGSSSGRSGNASGWSGSATGCGVRTSG